MHLVLDTREIGGKRDRSYFQTQLLHHKVRLLTRALELGDFVWVAKERDGGMVVVCSDAKIIVFDIS